MTYKTLDIVGIDTETSKSKFPWKDDYYLSLVSVYEPSGKKTTFTYIHDEQDDIYAAQLNNKALQKILNKYKVICGHNLKFDLIQLKHLGINLENHKFFCTMIAKYMIQYHMNHSLSLNDCARIEKLEVKDDRIRTMWDSGYETKEIPLSLLIPYCEHDAKLAYQLASRYITRLKSKGMFKCFALSMEFMNMLADMELNGIKFNVTKAQQIIKRYKKLVAVLESKIHKIAENVLHDEVKNEFNIRSKDDLSVLLYGGTLKRKKKVPKKTTKNVKTRMPYVFVYKDGTKKIKTRVKDHPNTECIRYRFEDVPYENVGLALKPLPRTEVVKSTSDCKFYSTDKSTISQLTSTTRTQKLVLRLLLKISVINKMLDTFQGKGSSGLLNKVDSNGYIHPNYNQARTATGRLSSNNPNSQNLPRAGTSPIKQCIIPRFDAILDGDLSQIELRVPAQFSGDPVMIQEINSGIDMHDRTRKGLMKLNKTKQNRVFAKIFNFRMIYRGSPWGFFKDPNMPSFKLKEWEKVIKRYWNKYRIFDQWHTKIINHVIQGNGTLQIPTGRMYKFKMYDGKYNEHQIVNYPIQGAAGADILPLCAVLIYMEIKRRKLKSIPILTVHDSIVFDVPTNEINIVANIMKHIFDNLDIYINKYWENINWVVKITGEIEAGSNYGNTKQIR